MTAAQAKKELKKFSDPKRAEHSKKFFKTGKGEYAEGDKFNGASVPNTRKVAKKFIDLPRKETEKLIHSKIHEERFLGLIILVYQYKKCKDPKCQKNIYDYYLKQYQYINNWDLVDCTCRDIIGYYLLDKADRSILEKWANSRHLWKKRIAIISTWTFIKHLQFEDTIKIATMLLKDDHDLIHKAVGWMLREVGNKNKTILLEYLDQHYKNMPRTMLRYAIEKLPEKTRQDYLKSKR